MKKEVRNNFLFSLILSSLFSLIIIFSIQVTNEFYLILFSPVLILFIELIYPQRQDVLVSILLTVTFVYLNTLIIFTPFILSFIMLFIPIYYFKGFSNEEILENLGFKGSIIRAILYSIASLVPLFLIYILLIVLAYVFNFNDSENVVNKVLDLPLYLMFYAVLVAPFVEEIFFRSFLVRLFMDKTSFLSKINSELISSFLATVLFSLAHFSYGSLFELMGTFFMGYALYGTFRVSKDIKVPIIIHMLINLISLIFMHLVV